MGCLVFGYGFFQRGKFGGCLLMLGCDLSEHSCHYCGATVVVRGFLCGRLGILKIRLEVCKETIRKPVSLQFCAFLFGNIFLTVNLVKGCQAENTENCGDKVRKIHF